MKHLRKNGLSITQAQSISNMCNQRAQSILADLSKINNASKTIVFEGLTYDVKKGYKMPNDIQDKIKELGSLRACQAFLMSNLKERERLIEKVAAEEFEYSFEEPEMEIIHEPHLFDMVTEQDIIEKYISPVEYAEYLECEAYAAHIGMFIHNEGMLDLLRKDLAKNNVLEWIRIKEGERVPVKVEFHHTDKELIDVHEELAKLHRNYEKRVNYYKAKIANLLAEANRDVDMKNKDILEEYNLKVDKARRAYTDAYNKWADDKSAAHLEWRKDKSKRVSVLSALKISIDSRFQPTINMFLEHVTDDDK